MYTYTGLVHKGPSESIFHSQHCLCTSALWSLLLQRSFLGRLIVLKIPLHQVCLLAGAVEAPHALLLTVQHNTSWKSGPDESNSSFLSQQESHHIHPESFINDSKKHQVSYGLENSSTMATTSHTITSESSIMAMTFHPVHIKLSPSGLRSSIRSRHKLDRPKKLKFQPSLNAVSHHSGVTVNDVQVNVFVNTMNNLSEMSVIIEWDWLEAERNYLETDKIPA